MSRWLYALGGTAVGALGFLLYDKFRRRNGDGGMGVDRVGRTPPVSAIVEQHPALKFGHPGPFHDERLLHAYCSSYSRQHRNANWVAEHLTKSNQQRNKHENADREKASFKEDKNIPEKYRSRLKDYLHSGYDRGHLVPAADAKQTQEALNETFLLSNISPQVGKGFNRDYWSYFENFIKSLVHGFDNLYVFTGPLYLPKKNAEDNKFYVGYEVIGHPPNVAVPTHFFKVVLADLGDQFYVAAFVLPNTAIPNSTPLTSFQVPLESLEKSSGLDFFQKLDRGNLLDLCGKTPCHISHERIEQVQRLRRIASDIRNQK